MGGFSPWHLLILAVVFVLLFAANKLPQMARSVGQSMRIFKAEVLPLSGEQEHDQPGRGQLPPAASAPPSANPAGKSSPTNPQEQPPVS